MKHMKLTPIALFFLILLPSNYAHASFFGSYAEMYTVGSAGSTVQKTEFTLNQNPELYIEFYSTPPAGGLTNQSNLYTVQSPNANIYFPYSSSTTNQYWVSYPGPVWDSVKTVGTWTVTANSFNDGQPLTGQTTFRVNAAPEPVGTVLFLTGGIVMAICILRRKKALVV